MPVALVTGSRGFVGTHLLRALVAAGYSTVPFDLQAGDDVRDYEQIRLAVETTQPDLIFHLAAQAYVAESMTDPRRTLDVNTVGTLNLLEAARNTGCRARILLAGTSEEYGYNNQPGPTVHELSPTLPTTPYGVSKLAATTLGQVYAQHHGLHVVCTRAFNHTGPGQPAQYALPAFARRVAVAERTGQPVAHGNLDAVRNYTDVRDVVRAYIGLLVEGAAPGIYNVASPYTFQISKLLDLLAGHASAPVPLVADDALWRPSGSDVFYPPDISKIYDAIGWTPQISISDLLRDLLDYWRGQV